MVQNTHPHTHTHSFHLFMAKWWLAWQLKDPLIKHIKNLSSNLVDVCVVWFFFLLFLFLAHSSQANGNRLLVSVPENRCTRRFSSSELFTFRYGILWCCDKIVCTDVKQKHRAVHKHPVCTCMIWMPNGIKWTSFFLRIYSWISLCHLLCLFRYLCLSYCLSHPLCHPLFG